MYQLYAGLGDVEQLLQGRRRSCHLEKRYLRKQGDIVWVQVSISLVRDGAGQPLYVIAQIQDITARRQQEEQLRRHSQTLEGLLSRLTDANAELDALARRDGLTGLWNRRFFQDQLENSISFVRSMGYPLSVVLLDLDHFKDYNDRFGHPAGDEVLRTTGRLLRGSLREIDFVARYGGEEFVIMLPNTSGAQAVELAERVRRVIAGHAWPHREVTASLGVASLSPEREDAPGLLAAADRALYAAKASGRNCVRSER